MKPLGIRLLAGAVQYETITEAEIVKDKETGEEVAKPVRTVRRPVVMQGAAAFAIGQSQPQQTPMEKRLHEMMEFDMMRMMISGGESATSQFNHLRKHQGLKRIRLEALS